MTPRASLFLPPAALSGCLFSGIYRDTRGVEMRSADRVNHFPASPLVSVTWIGCGELRLITALPQYASDAPLPPLFAIGPTDCPVSSWAPGPVLAFTIGIYHDAWLKLGGERDYARVPCCLAEALESFARHEEPEAGWEAFCETLKPVWTEERATGGIDLSGVSDWVRSVSVRAAMSSSGLSLRSFERRLKRLSGQTRRTLEFFDAVEALHKLSHRNPDAALADVALDAGYSDQSHMGRAVRRATGFSPARLNHAIKSEEAFWCYRLLGERF